MYLASKRHWELAALDDRLTDLDQWLDLLSSGPQQEVAGGQDDGFTVRPGSSLRRPRAGPVPAA